MTFLKSVNELNKNGACSTMAFFLSVIVGLDIMNNLTGVLCKDVLKKNGVCFKCHC